MFNFAGGEPQNRLFFVGAMNLRPLTQNILYWIYGGTGFSLDYRCWWFSINGTWYLKKRFSQKGQLTKINLRLDNYLNALKTQEILQIYLLSKYMEH